MSFRPHGKTHAVDAAVFQLLLKEPLPASAVNSGAFGRDLPWSAQLPGRRDVAPTIDLSQLQAGKEVTFPFPIGGTEFVLFQPDGSPAWLLRIARDQISVECHVYTRWQQVWTDAAAYLSEALANLIRRGNALEVSRFVLQVTDKFTCDGAAYDIAELMKPSDVVANVTLSRKNAWHSHAGWYERSKSGWTLQNINVDLTPVPQAEVGDTVSGWQVRILHFQRRHFATAIVMSADPAKNSTAVDAVANELHAENKRMLISILTDKAAADVGLTG